MTPRDRISPWPLVARDDELAASTTAWSSRRCQGVMNYGPGGVGKSRLAEECSHRAAEAGFTIGRATATQAAAAVPLGAIAHLIPPGVDLADPVRGFAEVAHVLAGPRRNRRWALLIDDLHWLDTTSVVLLRQLIDAGIVRLIGTVRTGGRTGSAVDDTCGGDAVRRVDLAEFSPHQLEIVLRAALGGPMGRRTLRTLHTASGGNALYLREPRIAATGSHVPHRRLNRARATVHAVFSVHT